MTEQPQPLLTRRRMIATGSTLAVAGTAGLALSTDTARAEVTVDDGLSIDNGEFSPADASVFTPWLLISGAWEYSVDTAPAKWECYLLLYGPDGNSETVEMTSGEVSSMQDSGTYGLRGAATVASFYETEDFTVPDGQESVSVTIPAEVALVIRDADDSMLAQDRAADQTTVTVNRDGEITTGVGGTGEVVMQNDETDPTPTPPPA